MSSTQDQDVSNATQSVNQLMAESAKSSRLVVMDIQRGLIMMLMAFAHCREYLGAEHYANLAWNNSPDWQGTSLLDFLQQALISLTVAGGFFLMMGMGIVFLYQARLKNGWTPDKICGYLAKRGLLLIFIQLTLLQAFEIFAEKHVYFYLGVLFSLGSCMILSSLCLYLISKFNFLAKFKYYFLVFILVSIPCLNQLIINHVHYSDVPRWAAILLMEGPWHENIDINFLPLPWFPAVAFGLLLGNLIQDFKAEAFKIIALLSMTFIFSWILTRTGNVTGWFHFGDYKFFPPHTPFKFANLFSISKHPPSIAYFLWAMGINMACLTCLYYINKIFPILLKPLQPLSVFGRCALFFFILHWFVYYGISGMVGNRYTDVTHLSLVWLYGLIILYLACKLFYQFKQTTPQDSIWRMF